MAGGCSRVAPSGVVSGEPGSRTCRWSREPSERTPNAHASTCWPGSRAWGVAKPCGPTPCASRSGRSRSAVTRRQKRPSTSRATVIGPSWSSSTAQPVTWGAVTASSSPRGAVPAGTTRGDPSSSSSSRSTPTAYTLTSCPGRRAWWMAKRHGPPEPLQLPVDLDPQPDRPERLLTRDPAPDRRVGHGVEPPHRHGSPSTARHPRESPRILPSAAPVPKPLRAAGGRLSWGTDSV